MGDPDHGILKSSEHVPLYLSYMRVRAPLEKTRRTSKRCPFMAVAL